MLLAISCWVIRSSSWLSFLLKANSLSTSIGVLGFAAMLPLTVQSNAHVPNSIAVKSLSTSGGVFGFDAI